MNALVRLILSAIAGLLVAVGLAAEGHGSYAPLAAWDTAAVLFAGSVLVTVLRFDARQTKSHALRENPGRPMADALLMVASIAS